LPMSTATNQFSSPITPLLDVSPPIASEIMLRRPASTEAGETMLQQGTTTCVEVGRSSAGASSWRGPATWSTMFVLSGGCHRNRAPPRFLKVQRFLAPPRLRLDLLALLCSF
jgi:hypothetical protein